MNEKYLLIVGLAIVIIGGTLAIIYHIPLVG